MASFLSADGKDVVLSNNATTGVNAVLRCFDFREGERNFSELAYGGVRNAAEAAARRRGARVCVCRVLRTVTAGEESLIQAVEAKIRPQTRLALDHVTSESAFGPARRDRFPVSPSRYRSCWPMAHMRPVRFRYIEALGVDCTWKSSQVGVDLEVAGSCGSILHDRPPFITRSRPGAHQGFTLEFDWPGTRDPTPQLTVPAAIAFMRGSCVEAVQSYNHRLAWQRGGTMAVQHRNTKLLGLVGHDRHDGERAVTSIARVPPPTRQRD